MKFITGFIFLLASLTLLLPEADAQNISVIDNSSLISLFTYRIILKEQIKAEAKILKDNKVKKIYLKNSKEDFWAEKITSVNKNGYYEARYSFDTLQTPDSEIRVKYDDDNNPTAIYQYESDGENYFDFFSYDKGKVTTIIHLGDSAKYPVGEPFYSDNTGEPFLTKIKLKNTKDDYYFINFKYNDADKLIRVYEEGAPDTYKIKYEPDKITITTVENESITMEFKNNIVVKNTILFDNNAQNVTYTYTFKSSGLRESTTMSFNGESFTQYYTYEYYK